MRTIVIKRSEKSDAKPLQLYLKFQVQLLIFRVQTLARLIIKPFRRRSSKQKSARPNQFAVYNLYQAFPYKKTSSPENSENFFAPKDHKNIFSSPNEVRIRLQVQTKNSELVIFPKLPEPEKLSKPAPAQEVPDFGRESMESTRPKRAQDLPESCRETMEPKRSKHPPLCRQPNVLSQRSKRPPLRRQPNIDSSDSSDSSDSDGETMESKRSKRDPLHRQPNTNAQNKSGQHDTSNCWSSLPLDFPPPITESQSETRCILTSSIDSSLCLPPPLLPSRPGRPTPGIGLHPPSRDQPKPKTHPPFPPKIMITPPTPPKSNTHPPSLTNSKIDMSYLHVPVRKRKTRSPSPSQRQPRHFPPPITERQSETNCILSSSIDSSLHLPPPLIPSRPTPEIRLHTPSPDQPKSKIHPPFPSKPNSRIPTRIPTPTQKANIDRPPSQPKPKIQPSYLPKPTSRQPSPSPPPLPLPPTKPNLRPIPKKPKIRPTPPPTPKPKVIPSYLPKPKIRRPTPSPPPMPLPPTKAKLRPAILPKPMIYDMHSPSTSHSKRSTLAPQPTGKIHETNTTSKISSCHPCSKC